MTAEVAAGDARFMMFGGLCSPLETSGGTGLVQGFSSGLVLVQLTYTDEAGDFMPSGK